MLRERNRIANRRMIFLALCVWMGAQALLYLEPSGVPGALASYLIITGFIALPVILVWPWLQNVFTKVEREDPLRQVPEEGRYQALISLEIAALSSMLIFLVMQVPSS